MLVNPGFETDQGWVLPVTAHTAGYSTQIARSGLRSLRTGIYGTSDIYSYSSGYQDVLIPVSATGATLSFWWYPISAEGPMAVAAGSAPDPALVQAVVNGAALAGLPAAVLAGDVQYVVLVDPQNGDILQTLLWTRSNAQAWQEASFAVSSALIGRTVRVQFGTYNDGNGLSSSTFIDDVALSTCPPTPTATVTPTSSPTPTRTPTPSPSPMATASASCAQLLVDPGFETDQGWMLPVTAHTAGYSTQIARSGLRSSRTGIYGTPDLYSYSSGYQDVLIPAGASGATLSLWWYPISAEGPMAVAAGGAPDPALIQAVASGTLPTGVLAGDVQYVVVADQNGNILQTLLWTRSNAQAWQTASFAVSPALMGLTVRVQFGTYNDGNGLSSSMFIDDVALSTCQPPALSARVASTAEQRR